jgi:hypothetical protein
MNKTNYTGLVVLITALLIVSNIFILKQDRKQKEYYENLVVEELVGIYGSEEYGYVIEELVVDVDDVDDDVVFVCIIKFYDGNYYNESIVRVEKNGFVCIELEILEIHYPRTQLNHTKTIKVLEKEKK